MRAQRNLKGLEWRGGAIGNAEWSGAKLSDVLKVGLPLYINPQDTQNDVQKGALIRTFTLSGSSNIPLTTWSYNEALNFAKNYTYNI